MRADAQRREFESQLSRALEMSDDEDAAYDVVDRSFQTITPHTPVELLLADNSHAHLERVVVAGPRRDGPRVPGRLARRLRRRASGADPGVRRQRGPRRLPDAARARAGSLLGRVRPGLDHGTHGRRHPHDRPGRRAARRRVGAGAADARQPGGQPPRHAPRDGRDAAAGVDRRAHRARQPAQPREPRCASLRGDGAEFAFVMADLDHFKALNDTHGHEAGDRALRIFSETLRARAARRRPRLPLRRRGVRDRAPRASTPTTRSTSIERIRSALAATTGRGDAPTFTASFGIAHSSDADDLEDLVQRADRALFAAKAAGRDRICLDGHATPVATDAHRARLSASGSGRACGSAETTRYGRSSRKPDRSGPNPLRGLGGRTWAELDAQLSDADVAQARELTRRGTRGVVPALVTIVGLASMGGGALVAAVFGNAGILETAIACGIAGALVGLPLSSPSPRSRVKRGRQMSVETIVRERVMQGEARRREFETRLGRVHSRCPRTRSRRSTSSAARCTPSRPTRRSSCCSPTTATRTSSASSCRSPATRRAADVRSTRPTDASPPGERRRRCSATARTSTPARCCAGVDRGRCSGVCVPVSIMGRTVGVVHATGAVGEPLDDDAVAALQTLANQAGNRVGMLRVMAETQLQASTDGLTGLVNRRSLENRVRQLRSEGTEFALVMADLDHFKALNDAYGHETGDRALRIFSETLRGGVAQPTTSPAATAVRSSRSCCPASTCTRPSRPCERIREALDDEHRTRRRAHVHRQLRHRALGGRRRLRRSRVPGRCRALRGQGRRPRPHLPRRPLDAGRADALRARLTATARATQSR